jgi:predicted DNA binding CopG/RHH family protein
MKNFDLTDEEKQLLDEFERGEWVEMKNAKQEKRRYQRIAKNTLNKLKNINIRISFRDLQKFKARAIEQGLPYQSIASVLIHQYANDRLELSL